MGTQLQVHFRRAQRRRRACYARPTATPDGGAPATTTATPTTPGSCICPRSRAFDRKHVGSSSPSEQKQMLGERLFPLIQGLFPDMAGKITGMLLEIDNSELVHMLEHKESLSSKVEEAVAVLSAHKTTPE